MTVNIGEVATFPGVQPDKAQAVKILEESAEIFAAWQSWHDSFETIAAMRKSWLLDECADVIQAVSNLIAALGVDDFTPYMESCKQRNQERGRYEPR